MGAGMSTVLDSSTCCGSGCALERAPESVHLGTEGYLHSVETCGTVDGPGIRYVLFLNGCPLRCQYCHNPDAQGRPSGTVLTAEEAFKNIRKYKSFIRKGGLTISGGEPLLQAAFVQAVFQMAWAEGIHTTLDTSGFVGHLASDELLGLTDLILLDIKSFEPETYRNVTGVNLAPTLEFARRLDARGNKFWVRFVLVPGLTDAEENVWGLANFVGQLKNVERVEILPFHKMGEDKYKRSGIPYNLEDTPTPTLEQVEKVRSVFRIHGIEAL